MVVRGRPLGEGRGAVIMIHGRGAAPHNILELVPEFAHPELTYLAPAAAHGTWYPFGFMAPVEQNEPGISSAVGVIHDLIERAIAVDIREERIVLMGFSQGACLALTAAHRRPARYGGIVAYSGGLIGPPGTPWDRSGSFGGAPTFLGCGSRDGHIPEHRVRESATALEAMGACVTQRIYPGMGHSVNEDELSYTRDLLAALTSSS